MRKRSDPMHILGVIPARGSSKRIKDKNIRLLKGKPIIGYTIEAALDSRLLDRVVVSTDSRSIARVVKKNYDVEIIKRPAKFAKDDSPIEEALLHAVEYLKGKENYITDIVVLMQANVPIRKKGIIDEAIKKLINSDADSCVTCREASETPEVMKIRNAKGRLIPVVKDVSAIRKQEFPRRYLLDGAVDVIRAKKLYQTRGIRKAHIYLGKKVIPVIQKDKMYSLEIDTLDDFLLAKYYMEQFGAGK